MSVTIIAYGLSIDTNFDDLEWPWTRNSPYFAFFSEFDSFTGRLRHSGWRL